MIDGVQTTAKPNYVGKGRGQFLSQRWFLINKHSFYQTLKELVSLHHWTILNNLLRVTIKMICYFFQYLDAHLRAFLSWGCVLKASTPCQQWLSEPGLILRKDRAFFSELGLFFFLNNLIIPNFTEHFVCGCGNVLACISCRRMNLSECTPHSHDVHCYHHTEQNSFSRHIWAGSSTGFYRAGQ